LKIFSNLFKSYKLCIDDISIISSMGKKRSV